MITLRYHFLTLVAIFLSLGIGIILGGSVGQNWVNEKQQMLLESLEKRYDEAMKNNIELQQQLNVTNGKMEQTNKEFSRFVSSDYLSNLQGKDIGLWHNPQVEADQIIQLLTSAGLKIIDLGEEGPGGSISYPVIVLGDALPGWHSKLEKAACLQVNHTPSTASEQWELLRGIEKLYRENKHEY